MNKFIEALMKYASGRDIKLDEDVIKKDLKVEDTPQEGNTLEILKSHDYEKQISVEIIAEPYTPDAHGHWYSTQTIEKGKESFDKAWKEGRLHMNLFHQVDDTESKHLELLKHYVVPFDCTVNNEPVKEGSWVAEVKWKNSELWKKRTQPLEDGSTEIGGLSIRGWGKIQEPESLEKASTSSVTKDEAGNLVYRGKKFPAYNKPRKSWIDGKQGAVLAKKGDEIKVVHFGDSSMRDNYSVEANDAYYARHGTTDDKFSAKYWSNKYLWPRGSAKGKGPKELHKLK